MTAQQFTGHVIFFVVEKTRNRISSYKKMYLNSNKYFKAVIFYVWNRKLKHSFFGTFRKFTISYSWPPFEWRYLLKVIKYTHIYASIHRLFHHHFSVKKVQLFST